MFKEVSMKKSVAATILAISMVAAISGCSNPAAPAATTAAPAAETNAAAAVETAAAPAAETTAAAAETPSAGKTELNVAVELMATTNEASIDWDSWYVQRYGVAECLVRNGDSGSFEPWLAESWEVADDNLTWTFKLRDDVKFSNGVDMTATKVVESIERLYDITDPEKGGNGLPQGYMTYSSISADDAAGTVTIVTENPTPDMPGVVAYPWMFIMDVEGSKDIDTVAMAPICTGPYVMTSFTEGLSSELVRNEYYYDDVPFEKVNIMRVAESASRTMALQDGSADMAINIAAADQELLESDSNITVDRAAGSRICVTFMNFENKFLADKTLRDAINMAIDGETIASVTTRNAYLYGFAPVPSSYDFGYDELTNPTPYDVDAAVKLLDDAGIVDNDGDGIRELNGENIELNYVVQANRSMDLIGQAISAQLADIGIAAPIQLVEHLNDYLSNKNYDLINASYVTMPTGDPGSFFSHWRTDFIDNYCGYSNSEFDETFDAMKGEFDAAKRREYIIQLQQILLDDSAMHVNGYFTTNIAYTNKIKDVFNNPSDFYWVNKNIKPAE